MERDSLMDITNNFFFKSLLELNAYCKKANIAIFPTMKLHFKTKRDAFYFIAQCKQDWSIELGIINFNKSFQMAGIEVEFIIDEKF